MPLCDHDGLGDTKLLTKKKPLPKFQWDKASTWASWVFGCSFGPMVVQICIYQYIKYIVIPCDLNGALTALLVWSLALGLALAGLGQIMQALAHDLLPRMSTILRNGGALVGVVGWSAGLLAGVLFSLVDYNLPAPKGLWDDPINYVMPIALVAPFLLWVTIVFVRPAWVCVREYIDPARQAT